MRLYVFNSCLKVIKTCIPIRQDKHNICIPGKEKVSLSIEHLFSNVVIWNKIIENININVLLVRFKHSLKDFLVFNCITFR